MIFLLRRKKTLHCIIDAPSLPFIISMRETNIRSEPYFINLVLNGDQEIVAAHCSCTAGVDGLCKHACAVAHKVNAERPNSKTYEKCSWYEPSHFSKIAFTKGVTVASIFKTTDPIELPKWEDEPDEQDVKEFVDLCETHGTTFSSFYKTMTVKINSDQGKVAESERLVFFPPSVRALFFD